MINPPLFRPLDDNSLVRLQTILSSARFHSYYWELGQWCCLRGTIRVLLEISTEAVSALPMRVTNRISTESYNDISKRDFLRYSCGPLSFSLTGFSVFRLDEGFNACLCGVYSQHPALSYVRGTVVSTDSAEQLQSRVEIYFASLLGVFR